MSIKVTWYSVDKRSGPPTASSSNERFVNWFPISPNQTMEINNFTALTNHSRLPFTNCTGSCILVVKIDSVLDHVSQSFGCAMMRE